MILVHIVTHSIRKLGRPTRNVVHCIDIIIIDYYFYDWFSIIVIIKYS